MLSPGVQKKAVQDDSYMSNLSDIFYHVGCQIKTCKKHVLLHFGCSSCFTHERLRNSSGTENGHYISHDSTIQPLFNREWQLYLQFIIHLASDTLWFIRICCRPVICVNNSIINQLQILFWLILLKDSPSRNCNSLHDCRISTDSNILWL